MTYFGIYQVKPNRQTQNAKQTQATKAKGF
jgi:hypothetical protein